MAVNRKVSHSVRCANLEGGCTNTFTIPHLQARKRFCSRKCQMATYNRNRPERQQEVPPLYFNPDTGRMQAEPRYGATP